MTCDLPNNIPMPPCWFQSARRVPGTQQLDDRQEKSNPNRLEANCNNIQGDKSGNSTRRKMQAPRNYKSFTKAIKKPSECPSPLNELRHRVVFTITFWIAL